MSPASPENSATSLQEFIGNLQKNRQFISFLQDFIGQFLRAERLTVFSAVRSAVAEKKLAQFQATTKLLEGLMEGKSLEEILAKTPSEILNQRIEESNESALPSQEDILRAFLLELLRMYPITPELLLTAPETLALPNAKVNAVEEKTESAPANSGETDVSLENWLFTQEILELETGERVIPLSKLKEVLSNCTSTERDQVISYTLNMLSIKSMSAAKLKNGQRWDQRKKLITIAQARDVLKMIANNKPNIRLQFS